MVMLDIVGGYWTSYNLCTLSLTTEIKQKLNMIMDTLQYNSKQFLFAEIFENK